MSPRESFTSRLSDLYVIYIYIYIYDPLLILISIVSIDVSVYSINYCQLKLHCAMEH